MRDINEEIICQKNLLENPKRNAWVFDSGSSSGNDFKLKSQGTSYIYSGKKN